MKHRPVPVASVVFLVIVLLILFLTIIGVEYSNKMAYDQLCKYHGYDYVSGLFTEAICVKTISVPVSDLLERDE